MVLLASDTDKLKSCLDLKLGEKVAAIDLGTNSCRLLIAEYTGEEARYKAVHAFSRMVRLGEGVLESGNLVPASMERAVDALKICAQKMKDHGVKAYRAVATAACRMAENGPVLLENVRQVTGLHVEIINTEEEAALSLLGCSGLLSPQKPYGIVFDIGGGSTEILWVAVEADGNLKAIDLVSLPIGVVTPPLHLPMWEKTLTLLEEALETLTRRNGIDEAIAKGQVQMVGTSGTVTTLAAIHLNLAKYDRANVDGVLLSAQDVLGVINLLEGMSHEQRVAHPCVGSSRADLIIPGTRIFRTLHTRWPVQKLCVADRGVREGILTKILQGDSKFHWLDRSSDLKDSSLKKTDLLHDDIPTPTSGTA